MISKLVGKNKDLILVFFRVLVALLFMEHGAQKLFGFLSDRPHVPYFSLMGLAGAIEFFGGILLALGLLTRYAAFLCASEMVVAYLKVHIHLGTFPIQNQGELALLYFASFLMMILEGGGKWSLDALFCPPHDT